MVFEALILSLLERHPQALTFNEMLKELGKRSSRVQDPRQKRTIHNTQLSNALKRLIRQRRIERTLRLANYRLTWIYGKPNPRRPRIEWDEIEKVAEGLTAQEAEQIIDLTAASLQLFIRSLTMGCIDPRLLRSVFARLEKESYWPEVRDVVHAMLGRFGCE
jgi:hypothetical protein